MEIRGQRPTLREAGAGARGLQPHDREGPVGKPPVRGKAGRRSAAAVAGNSSDHSAVGSLGFFCIDIFSGEEEFSRAFWRMGYNVYSFDILQGKVGDLTIRATQRRLYRLLRSGMCLGLLSGTPCASFSWARGGGERAPRGGPAHTDGV